MSNCSVQTLEIVLYIYLCVTYFVLVWYLIESILCFVAKSIKLVCDICCIQNKRMRIKIIYSSTVSASIAIQYLLISLSLC